MASRGLDRHEELDLRFFVPDPVSVPIRSFLSTFRGPMRMQRNVLAVISVLAFVPFGCDSGSDAGIAAPPASPEGASDSTNAVPGAEAVPPDAVPPAAAGTTDSNAENGDTPASEAPPATDGTPVSAGTEGEPAVNGGVDPTGAQAETGGAVGAPEPSETPGASRFHVFLLLGQSNMAGYPKAQPEDRVEDPRVRVLGFDDCAATGRQTDQWDVAAPPLHECWNDGLGPADYFAKTLLEVIPEGDTIGLVPCAISGSAIEPFLKVGGTRYDYIVRRARMAQDAGGVIEGILFHQGESNNNAPDWPAKVNTLVTDLRADLALGDVPFLAGELLYTGGAAGHNARVNQIPGIVSNSFVISANGLVVDPADTEWNLHFSHDSVVEQGKRYAQTMIEALGME
jgi:hypothetical protein